MSDKAEPHRFVRLPGWGDWCRICGAWWTAPIHLVAEETDENVGQDRTA